MKALVKGYQPPLDEARAHTITGILMNTHLSDAASELESNFIGGNALMLMLPSITDLLRLIEYMAAVGYLLRRIVQDCADTNDKADELLELLDANFSSVSLNMFEILGENIAANNRKEVTK